MIIYNYITTNLLNNKKYTGMHRSDSVDDGYLGSGLLILRAIKKYGKENFIREILCFCKTEEEAFVNEKIFIREYNSLSPMGYNLSPDGGTRNNGSHSKETKEKIGKAHKGKKLSEEHRQKLSESHIGQTAWNKGKVGCFSKETLRLMSESSMGKIAWNKGRSTPEEVKKKIGDGNRGKNISETTRRKISEATKGEKNHSYGKRGEETSMFGRHHSLATKEKMRAAQLGGKNHNYGKTGKNNPKSKPILQYDRNECFIKEWAGATEAERELGVHRGNIGACVRGESPTAYGFIWKFKETGIKK